MTHKKATVALTIACAFASARGMAQESAPTPEARPEVLVLGVYHMANPGSDVFNTKADDVLAPKRQAEIAELITVLKRFKPTKIAVEALFHNSSIGRRYDDYVKGNYELTRNEIHQIGFRLAKELGHSTVYPVDVDGDYPFPRLVKYAKATDRSKDFDALMSEIGESAKATDRYLASHTILETLLYLNADDRTAADVGQYFQYAAFGEPWDWAGADLVADWMRRNMRIYTNVVKLIESPNERVLVVYGSGHLGWLRQAVAGNANLRLRTLADLVQ